jgi:hypothetical protein
MKVENIDLLKRIEEFDMNVSGAALTFTKRLARENGWSEQYAQKVINEYKRFVYMSVIAGKPLTPSDEVDQAWHMHLIYSKSYWVDFCQKTLGGFQLHHGPTKGGKSEGMKFTDQYTNTLNTYKEHFGTDAPSDVWPSVADRFRQSNFQRIDKSEKYVLDRKKVKAYALSMLLVPVLFFLSAFLMSAKTDDDSSIIWFIVIAVVAIFVIRGLYRYANRDERKSSYKSGSSGSSDSGCGVIGSFFGCGSSDSGCGSSGCGSSCGSSCGGGCGGD